METPFAPYRSLPKEQRYTTVLPLLQGLLHGETDTICALANVAAALKEAFDFFWVGFYLVHEDATLHLGPFQGPVACTRIAHGRGVCGTAWAEGRTVLVEDVEQFPGHIACSSLSRSEIVVPIRQGDRVVAVLDIDSEHLAHFDATDQRHLEHLCDSLATLPF